MQDVFAAPVLRKNLPREPPKCEFLRPPKTLSAAWAAASVADILHNRWLRILVGVSRFQADIDFVNGHWAAISKDQLPTAVPAPGPMSAVHPSVYYDGFHTAYPKWQNGGYDPNRKPFVWDSRKGVCVAFLFVLQWSRLTHMVCTCSTLSHKR